MEIIRKEKFMELAKQENDHLVSVYIPTHSHGQEVNEKKDTLALKNALKDIVKKLGDKGKNRNEIEKITQPVRQLLEDSSFWRHQEQGLAIFASEDYFEKFTIPEDTRMISHVNHNFFLKPLLPVITGNSMFYLLTVSKSGIRLYHCSRYKFSEEPIQDKIPASMEEALKWDVPEKSLQFHSGDRSESAMYHGHGANKDHEKINIARYFRIVDNEIMDYLEDRESPMIIAGTENMIPIYKENSRYPSITSGSVQLEPESVSLKQLHKKAVEILDNEVSGEKTKHIRRFEKLAGTGKTSTNPELIISSAYYKNIDALFVLEGSEIWGKMDRESSNVQIDEKETPENEELVNLAVIYTLLNGGRVYTIRNDEFPVKDKSLSAILRAEVSQ